jgi:hypothetical protein
MRRSTDVLSVNIWLQCRSLPARWRVSLEVHRCIRTDLILGGECEVRDLDDVLSNR